MLNLHHSQRVSALTPTNKKDAASVPCKHSLAYWSNPVTLWNFLSQVFTCSLTFSILEFISVVIASINSTLRCCMKLINASHCATTLASNSKPFSCYKERHEVSEVKNWMERIKRRTKPELHYVWRLKNAELICTKLNKYFYLNYWAAAIELLDKAL